MRRSLALLYVAGLFFLGVLIGASGMHLYDAHGDPGPPGEWPARQHRPHSPDRLGELLDLTPQQREQVDEILARRRVEARALHEELLPRVRAHMRETRDEIVEILTPEQQARLEAAEREHRGRFERWFLGGGPRGHVAAGSHTRHPPPGP